MCRILASFDGVQDDAILVPIQREPDEDHFVGLVACFATASEVLLNGRLVYCGS